MSAPPATIRQCAILAGGLATRLGDIAAETPKPVLEVGGRPFIAWLMREMLRFGVDDFIILTGHLPRAVERAVLRAADALPRPVRVRFSEEPERAGTGGALFHAAPLLAGRFLMCNGDSLFDCNVAALLAGFAADGDDVLARMVVREIPDASRYGTVTLDGARVTAFRERPETAQAAPGLINAGIYAMDRRVLGRLSADCSLERDLLAPLASDGALRAVRQDGWFVDIGIPNDLARARRELAGCMDRPALFLVGDGVLTQARDGAAGQDGRAWVDGARAAVAATTARGWHVFTVTAQGGPARGGGGDAEAARQFWLTDALRRAGGTLDDWRSTTCGEAAVGIMADLLGVWELDPQRCVMVGKAQADVPAGMRSLVFPGGDLLAFLTNAGIF